jgi:hypothetical protein
MAKRTRRSERPTGGGARLPLRVDCQESARWLQFRARAQLTLAQDDLLPIDVMTLGEDGAPHKLCELLVARGDLLRAIAAAGDVGARR